jgi:V/A-type H+-transporting ATPase subunit I
VSTLPLLHLTLVGLEAGRDEALRALQLEGFAHLEEARKESSLAASDVSTAADGRRALRYLQAANRPWHVTHDRTGFSAAATTQRALELERAGRELREERHSLRRRVAELSPWGSFEFDPTTPDARRFWFYVVPNHQLRGMPDGLCWQVVHREQGSSYVVVIARSEPTGVPGPRTHAGTRGLPQLLARAEAVQLALDEIESQRAREARWRDLLSESLDLLQDEANLLTALQATGSEGMFFVVNAWIPAAQAAEVERFAGRLHLAHMLRQPRAGEQPPTLLANRGISAFGEDILKFYEVPAYGDWDPSTSVFWFLSVFVAVMIGDAGYSLLLGAGLLAFWRALGRSDTLRRGRRFAAVAIAASLAWGIAIGSWFGAAPAVDGLAASLALVDLSDTQSYVTLAVGLGVVQLSWANLAAAWHMRRLESIARVGWVLLLLAGVVAWQWPYSGIHGQSMGLAAWPALGGVAAIVLFTAPGSTPLVRLGQGAFALTRLVGLASDLLSYLRLFAIGFAGAALAGAFGDLADQAAAGPAGLGGLLAFLILLLGHGANLVLGVASAIVHGLRLNLIEYLNWSIVEEGRQFKAFSRKVGIQ